MVVGLGFQCAEDAAAAGVAAAGLNVFK